MMEMVDYWKMLDTEIENTPMPDEYKDMKVQVLCRDCHKVRPHCIETHKVRSYCVETHKVRPHCVKTHKVRPHCVETVIRCDPIVSRLIM